jgi:hypothetical protein
MGAPAESRQFTLPLTSQRLGSPATSMRGESKLAPAGVRWVSRDSVNAHFTIQL